MSISDAPLKVICSVLTPPPAAFKSFFVTGLQCTTVICLSVTLFFSFCLAFIELFKSYLFKILSMIFPDSASTPFFLFSLSEMTIKSMSDL